MATTWPWSAPSGSRPRLLRRSGRWAGPCSPVAALVVAVPRGHRARPGRLADLRRDLGVVPDPVTDPREIVVLALAALVLAILVGRWPPAARPAWARGPSCGRNDRMKHHRGAVAYCVRADARRSWPSWLALGVLVGLAAGAVMAATAAGNRTDSAYRDLRDETAAMDGAIALPCAVEDPATCPVIGEIRAWPGVADAARFATGAVPILDIDGHLVQANNDTCYSGSGAVNLITPIDPEFGTSLHRLRLLEGRLADPTRADEVVMAPLAAEALGVGVGDRLFPRPVGLPRGCRAVGCAHPRHRGRHRPDGLGGPPEERSVPAGHPHDAGVRRAAA